MGNTMQKELKSHLKNHSIKFNHPIHSFMVYIKNLMHVLYEDHSFSIVGLIWQIVCFPQDQFNFHSWVTAKFSRDITGLHTYIELLYTKANLIFCSPD